MQGQMDRQNGRRLQSHWWVFLVADSCRLIVGGAGGAIPGFADQHPEIGESDQRAGIVGTVTGHAPALAAFSPTLLAATSAFIAIQAFSTRPSMRFISLLQSFITSSALLFCLKLTIPAGRSMRAHTMPETTSRERSSSVSEVGRESKRGESRDCDTGIVFGDDADVLQGNESEVAMAARANDTHMFIDPSVQVIPSFVTTWASEDHTSPQCGAEMVLDSIPSQ
jgi:hypothetical protein